jgi:hypothetical protein
MNRKRFVIAISLMLAGTVAFAQNITFDFDKTADFTKFKTYACARATPLWHVLWAI